MAHSSRARGASRAALRFALRPLMVIALVGITWVAAADELSVRIVATDPASTETLYRGESLSVRLAYEAAIPLRFSVEGFAHGERLTGAHSNTVPVYPAGRGEAIVWLGFHSPVYLDEVRVRVMDEHWQVRDVLEQPVSFFWDRQPRAAPRAEAGWVAELNAAQTNMVRAAAAAQAAGQAGEEGVDYLTVLLMLMFWSVPGYIALQVYTLARYRDGWRKAALVPLVLMVPLIAYTLFALIAGSNLWPLMLIFLTPVAFLYLAGLLLLRFSRRRSQKPLP
jgi:hypothetical protein